MQKFIFLLLSFFALLLTLAPYFPLIHNKRDPAKSQALACNSVGYVSKPKYVSLSNYGEPRLTLLGNHNQSLVPTKRAKRPAVQCGHAKRFVKIQMIAIAIPHLIHQHVLDVRWSLLRAAALGARHLNVLNLPSGGN